MTNEEAIQHITTWMYATTDFPSKQVAEALTIALSALRQPPGHMNLDSGQNVIISDEPGRDFVDFICPRCKTIIAQIYREKKQIDYTPKFHDECGQRLLWPSWRKS